MANAPIVTVLRESREHAMKVLIQNSYLRETYWSFFVRSFKGLKRLRCKHIVACKILVNLSCSSRHLAGVIYNACLMER